MGASQLKLRLLSLLPSEGSTTDRRTVSSPPPTTPSAPADTSDIVASTVSKLNAPLPKLSGTSTTVAPVPKLGSAIVNVKMSLNPVVVGATILENVVAVEVGIGPKSCCTADAPALAPARTAAATACFIENLIILFLHNHVLGTLNRLFNTSFHVKKSIVFLLTVLFTPSLDE